MALYLYYTRKRNICTQSRLAHELGVHESAAVFLQTNLHQDYKHKYIASVFTLFCAKKGPDTSDPFRQSPQRVAAIHVHYTLLFEFQQPNARIGIPTKGLHQVVSSIGFPHAGKAIASRFTIHIFHRSYFSSFFHFDRGIKAGYVHIIN